ncbi:hypothetical protein [Flavobacterium succinicans]|uniref:Uncharacterized protein n=1 Tax=Flavobacterium succinicans TaxID=29536 RepID=A0A199XRY6_9FLAO|nr:hypothetical protein [Flavobacterium succinicans]OAZ04094.1 hypothetical protein FLB_17860 [Flavobacterium succinicans]
MKKSLLFLIAFSYLIQCYSQIKGIPTQEMPNAPKTVTFLAYDAFAYVYTIENNVFKKSKGSENWEYKNVTLGKITKVDLQNPLKIVLFYEDFNTVILLDNQLNESQRINFSEHPTPINATAVGIASQNQLWVYNNLNQQIGLYDYLKNEYKTISTPLPGKIKNYTTDFNSFIWMDDNAEGYSCSLFGAIRSIGKFPNADQVQIINSTQILYSVNQKISLLSRQKDTAWTSTPLQLSEKRFEKFYYLAQNLAIFTTEGIYNFKIILP